MKWFRSCLSVLYYSWKYRSWPTRYGNHCFWATPRDDTRGLGILRALSMVRLKQRARKLSHLKEPPT